MCQSSHTHVTHKLYTITPVPVLPIFITVVFISRAQNLFSSADSIFSLTRAVSYYMYQERVTTSTISQIQLTSVTFAYSTINIALSLLPQTSYPTKMTDTTETSVSVNLCMCIAMNRHCTAPDYGVTIILTRLLHVVYLAYLIMS